MPTREARFPNALNWYHYTFILEGIYSSKAEAHSRFEYLKRSNESLVDDDSKMRTLKKGEQTALYIWE